MNLSVVPSLPHRKRQSHKGKFGRVLIISGSSDYTGAPFLVTQSALRSGAGLVRLLVPKSIYEIEASRIVEGMVSAIPDQGKGYFGKISISPTLEKMKGQSVLAIGPGLGRQKATEVFIHDCLKNFQGPIILDADGLNAYTGRLEILMKIKKEMVLTPHPGEMERLLQKPCPESDAKRKSIAIECARLSGKIVVLKGSRTVVADPQGKVFINDTGNPAMASGGMGDVLTGVLAALIAQGMDLYAASCLAVHSHGSAGDLATRKVGQVGLLASDLLDYLPQTLSPQKMKKRI